MIQRPVSARRNAMAFAASSGCPSPRGASAQSLSPAPGSALASEPHSAWYERVREQRSSRRPAPAPIQERRHANRLVGHPWTRNRRKRLAVRLAHHRGNQDHTGGWSSEGRFAKGGNQSRGGEIIDAPQWIIDGWDVQTEWVWSGEDRREPSRARTRPTRQSLSARVDAPTSAKIDGL